jgi:hypothetical protein
MTYQQVKDEFKAEGWDLDNLNAEQAKLFAITWTDYFASTLTPEETLELRTVQIELLEAENSAEAYGKLAALAKRAAIRLEGKSKGGSK